MDISLLERLYYSGEISSDYFYNNYYLKSDKHIRERFGEDKLLSLDERLDIREDRINYKYIDRRDYSLYRDKGYIVIDIIENNIILGYLKEEYKDEIYEIYRVRGLYKYIKFIKIDEKLHTEILKKLLTTFYNKEKESVFDISKFINSMIFDAINKNASDIHIEPFKDIVNIRYRVNGELIIYKKITIDNIQELSSKLKIMSNLNIAEKRDIQDGEFTINQEGKVFNFRISIVPTIYGEKIAIRLLNTSRDGMKLGNLSLGYNLGSFKSLINEKSGLLLVTGPTGCGKTTSLYSILEELKETTNNIMTIEDPVEYKIDGINQIQVNNKIGFDFERGLKAILRQDPNIIMIGEIRDKETAISATRAAITGHLVLSTLHTNTAIDAVDRLLDMGVEPYMVAASLIGVVSQRLVKLLCPDCKRKYLSKEYHNSKLNIKESTYIYERVGCKNCSDGYIGRLAIFEVVTIDEGLKKRIKESRTIDKNHVNSKGKFSIYSQCVDLILDGLVEFDEIYNIGVKPW